MNTLIVDNYDSFTYNLYQMVKALNLGDVSVVLNDQLTPAMLARIDAVILSPGPGSPANASDIGVCKELLTSCELPMLGVCLGMQAMIHYSGGTISEAEQPVHGQVDLMQHDGSGLFQDIPSPFKAMRYHSLIATGVTEQWNISARNSQNIVMAVSHVSKPWWGVQFHPESIATEHGEKLLRNFFQLATRYRPAAESKPRVSPAKASVRRQTAKNWRLETKTLPWFDPESVFLQLYPSSANCFWLDSSLYQPGLSRYSIMGDDQGKHCFLAEYELTRKGLTQQWRLTQAGKQQQVTASAFAWLNEQLQSQTVTEPHPSLPFQGGLVGWLGYELKQECGSVNRHASNWPDAAFIFADRFIVFDHLKRETILAQLRRENEPSDNNWFSETQAQLSRIPRDRIQPQLTASPHTALRSSIDDSDYLTKVESARQFIKQGLSYELCLTQQYQLPYAGSGVSLYRHLRQLSPAPYASYIRINGLEYLSASPEQFLAIEPSGHISSKPIKGTVARGKDQDQDRENYRHLQNNIKDRAENLMIVDLLRNDLGRVCKTGSVHVSELLQVESYATLHQLVSRIEGTLSPQHTIIDCVQAAFPGGSMTGAPKLRSMELLDTLETCARGIYSGCCGYISLHNSCELSINIRGMVLHNGVAYIGSGGAVVWLSDADSELQEMKLKVKFLLDAITQRK